MAYSLEHKLVVAVASSALFDLRQADRIYREEGLDAFERYQREREDEVLERGVAFPFVRRLLSLNDDLPEDERPVEVVLLSRNDLDTGLRVFNSIEAHGLPITRGAFVSGREPFRYIEAFRCCLFLSANEDDVRRALARGLPAGLIAASPDVDDDQDDHELRVAFDFDGVVIDDEAESLFQSGGLSRFQESERRRAGEAHNPGPLRELFLGLAELQRIERQRAERRGVGSRVRVAIVTARNAPSHKRVVTTLRHWGVKVDEALFLGGLDKAAVLDAFQPHLFFDDQIRHIESASGVAPSVHVPCIDFRSALLGRAPRDDGERRPGTSRGLAGRD